MNIISKYIWILFVIVTIINGIILKYHSRKYIALNPDLKVGYDKLFKGWIFFGNIPWIIIAIGNLSGMTHNFFEYLKPGMMNPIVLIFHASIFALWILGAWWIYMNGGAAFLEKHPGLFQKNNFSGTTNITAKQVKIFYPIMILGGIAGEIMMWVTDIPVPEF